ncbi:hypothetical protein FH5_04066 [Priestia endophytica]|nr:hypothetical protein FH5_04066 [Priestia endophytica]
MRDKNQSIPTLKVIADEISQDIPVIEAGSVRAPEDTLDMMIYGFP